MDEQGRLPPWFHQDIPSAAKVAALKSSFDKEKINTVCQSARCPNLGACWGKGTATLMILGDVCTRACRFCAVKTGTPSAVDPNEPSAVAQAIKEMRLDHAVVTSVTRDDLSDAGAGHFARTIVEIRRVNPRTKIEVLIPDLLGDKNLIKVVADARPDVIAHNIETVRRLAPLLRPQADYERSLAVLKIVKDVASDILVKSGLMLGLGESDADIEETMKDLLQSGCDILTLGQYLAPSKGVRHAKVERFFSPEEFDRYKEKALALGFKYVLSAPLARSSYLAKEAYEGCLKFEEIYKS